MCPESRREHETPVAEEAGHVRRPRRLGRLGELLLGHWLSFLKPLLNLFFSDFNFPCMRALPVFMSVHSRAWGYNRWLWVTEQELGIKPGSSSARNCWATSSPDSFSYMELSLLYHFMKGLYVLQKCEVLYKSYVLQNVFHPVSTYSLS